MGDPADDEFTADAVIRGTTRMRFHPSVDTSAFFGTPAHQAESRAYALKAWGDQDPGSPVSDNQRALVKLLRRTHKLVSCVGGYAAWRSDVEWSQGRTPQNAIADADMQSLWRAGLIEGAGWCNHFRLSHLGESLDTAGSGAWKPASEGYDGPAYCD